MPVRQRFTSEQRAQLTRLAEHADAILALVRRSAVAPAQRSGTSTTAHVRLDAGLLMAFRAQAEREGRRLGDVLARALEAYLAEHAGTDGGTAGK